MEHCREFLESSVAGRHGEDRVVKAVLIEAWSDAVYEEEMERGQEPCPLVPVEERMVSHKEEAVCRSLLAERWETLMIENHRLRLSQAGLKGVLIAHARHSAVKADNARVQLQHFVLREINRLPLAHLVPDFINNVTYCDGGRAAFVAYWSPWQEARICQEKVRIGLS